MHHPASLEPELGSPDISHIRGWQRVQSNDCVETRLCHGRKRPSCAAVRALMSSALCFKEEQHGNALCKRCADKEQGLFTMALRNVAKVRAHFLTLLF